MICFCRIGRKRRDKKSQQDKKSRIAESDDCDMQKRDLELRKNS